MKQQHKNIKLSSERTRRNSLSDYQYGRRSKTETCSIQLGLDLIDKDVGVGRIPTKIITMTYKLIPTFIKDLLGDKKCQRSILSTVFL